MLKRMMGVLLVLAALTLPCMAVEQADIQEAQSEALELDELEEAAQPYLDGVTMENADLDEGLRSILNTGSEQLGGVIRKALHSGMLLLVIVLLAGVADGMLEGSQALGLPVVPLVSALAVTAVAVADVDTLLGLGEGTLSTMSDFSNILFPAVTALTAATGAITGAAARQLAVVLFTDILMNLMSRVLVPLVYAYLAASVAHAALGNDGLKRLAALFKWAVTIVLTVLLMAFVGYLTVSGVIAGHTDAAAIKAAKFALSTTIPVVGGILSDAAETVLAGAGVLRGTVGIYGTLAVLAMCLAPFLQLAAHYLTYKLAAALSATVADSRTAGLIDSIGSAFGLILGMTGAGALMLLVALVSALSVMNI